MIRVVGLGAGGHAKVLMDALHRTGGYSIAALADENSALWGSQVVGVKVLGDFSLLPNFRDQGIEHAFVGVGGAGDTGPRRRVYEIAIRKEFSVVTVIHPDATISRSATIGNGANILAGAVINADAMLGTNVIINTKAVVEHDCVIHNHVHLATGACLAGGVEVQEGAHIGLGASVLQGIRVGRKAIVGAGAVVREDVPDSATVVGVPARVVAVGTSSS